MNWNPPQTTAAVNAWCWLALLFGVLLFPNQAAAQDCYRSYRQKQFAQAADCFQKQANALGTNQRFKKGRLLRNAMLCLDKAAKASSGAQATALREKALTLFNSYKSEKLYENKEQLKRTAKLVGDLRVQIRYAQATVVTNHPRARACIRGNQFDKCNTGPVWTAKLRPGTYRVTVDYPLNPPIQKSESITLAMDAKRTVVFNPPISKDGRLTVVSGNARAQMSLTGPNVARVQVGPLWALTLPEGSYKLVIRYPNGKKRESPIQIASGKSAVKIFDPPPPPVLAVNSTPEGGRVFVDGRYVGRTPFKNKMEPGNYKVEVRKGCYLTQSKQINLSNQRLEALSFPLERDPIHTRWKKNADAAGGRRALGWTTLTLGVLLGGASVVAHVMANGEHDKAREAARFGADNYTKFAETGNYWRYGAHGGTGAAGLALAISVFSFATSNPGPEYRVPCQNRLEVWRLE